MKINADLSQRAVVYSEELPWVNSPALGVQRRMLERDGEENGRATTIVRFAPNSSFPMHSHGGGEEFLVLSGVFSDEHGDHGPGTYIRNPVGSQHTPYSKEGCIIFVKLCQMSPEDQNYVCIDTNQAAWEPGPIAGLKVMPLHRFGTERVVLIEWEAGIHFPHHTHEDGSEVFVLEGVLEDEYGSYPKGTWFRYPVGSSHAAFSPSGCLLYAKGGHLLPDLKQ
ncbi:MAG: cupin domain-containing protein [Hormoscilla sp. SP5CHS1]|nr:cupin domain-containing protein [Hormoscilla sp. SP12CHS1]MBC6456094.1 cupin domain-containing protein [Hormoscilla sp. SP5CHS1]